MSTVDERAEHDHPQTPLPRWAVFALIAVWASPLAPALLRRYAMEHDSINFALAASDYNLEAHQPQPAGFPWWVLLIRLICSTGIDPLMAQTLLALAFTAAAARLWIRFDGRDNPGGVFLLLLSPVAWFYAAVPSTYAVDLAFSCLVLPLAAKAWDGERRAAVWLAAAIGLWSGFRSPSAVFMAPLLLACAWRSRTLIRCGVNFGVLWLVWYVPVVWSAGGIEALNRIMREMTSPAFSRVSVLYGAPLQAHLNALIRLAIYLGLLLMPAILAASLSSRRAIRRALVKGNEGLLLALTAGPAFLFLVLIHNSKAGYCLILLAPVLAWLSARVTFTARAIAASTLASLLLSFFPFETVTEPANSYNITRASLRSLFLIENAHRAIAALPPQQDASVLTERSEGPNLRTLSYHFPSFRWTTQPGGCIVVANPWVVVDGARLVSFNAVYSLWRRDCERTGGD
jgi:hypothetical protein